MAQYVVTADDRAWFARCRRAWDLGAVARQASSRSPHGRPAASNGRMREALAVHYFPGMWSWDRTIVEPLVFAAYDRAHGPDESRPLLEDSCGGRPASIGSRRLRVEVEIDVHVPDPVLPDTHLAHARRAPRSGTATASPCARRRRDDRYWLGEHRVVEEFADDDELRARRARCPRVLGVGRDRVGERPSPVPSTPRSASTRRRSGGRGRADRGREGGRGANRLGRAVLEMLAARPVIEPTPEWSHCARCTFRAPCIAMNRGDDPRAMLATRYRARGPDVLEEGRLGGVSWGMGRGAAPPHL